MDLYQNELEHLVALKRERESFQKFLHNNPVDIPISSILDFLTTKDALLLSNVIRFLGSYRKKSVFPHIEKFHNHPLATVRGAVCFSIGAIRDKRGLDILMNCVKDKDRLVVWEAYVGLCNLSCMEALNIFIEGMKDTNEVVRMLCARALGNTPDLRSLGVLHMQSADSNSSVRAAIFETLGKIGHGTSLPYLVSAAKDPNPEVRCSAVLGISRFPKSENAYIFSNMANDASDNVRLITVQALEKTGTRECVRVLLRMLKDKNYMIRSAATAAIGNIGSFEELSSLIEMLRDSSWRVRASVAGALGKLGYSESIPQLLQMTKDSHAKVRSAAAKSLWMIDEHDSIDPNIAKELLGININMMETGDLIKRREGAKNFATQTIKQGFGILSKSIYDSDSEIRRFSAMALGKSREKRAFLKLNSLIHDRELSVRWETVELFDLFKRSLSETNVIRMLHDPNPSIRTRACTVLSQTHPLRAIGDLGKGIADPNPLVRLGAASALVQYNNPAVVAHLKPVLNDPEPTISFLASVKLGELGVEDALPVLINNLKSRWEHIRSESARAMVFLKFSKFGDIVLERMADPSSEVRKYLSACLIDCAGQAQAERMARYLRDEEPLVRANICRAYGEIKEYASQKHIQTALFDAEPVVRIAALETVAKLGWQDFVPIIGQLSKDRTPSVRLALVKALAGLKNENGKKTLLKMIEREENADICHEAILALGGYRSADIRKYLLRLLKQTNLTKSKAAFKGLQKIGMHPLEIFFYKYFKAVEKA